MQKLSEVKQVEMGKQYLADDGTIVKAVVDDDNTICDGCYFKPNDNVLCYLDNGTDDLKCCGENKGGYIYTCIFKKVKYMKIKKLSKGKIAALIIMLIWTAVNIHFVNILSNQEWDTSGKNGLMYSSILFCCGVYAWGLVVFIVENWKEKE